jgi:hypothetical protein
MSNFIIGGAVEWEYQFADFVKKDIIYKLKAMGAKKVHSRMKYNATYFYKPNKKEFYRIRQEGNNILLTKKILRNKQKLPPIEDEIIISKGSTYQEIIDFVRAIVPKNYYVQKTEKYREKWNVGRGCHEVVFDEWPGIPVILEVDCTSKKSLLSMIKKLGLQNTKSYTRGAFDIYQELYDLPDRSIMEGFSIRFCDIKQHLNKYVRKNKNVLDQFQKRYNKMNRLYS